MDSAGNGAVGQTLVSARMERDVSEPASSVWPDEPTGDHFVPITIKMARQYLGLSARYLNETGAVTSETVFNWESLVALEQLIYPRAEGTPHGTDSTKEAIPIIDGTGHESGLRLPRLVFV